MAEQGGSRDENWRSFNNNNNNNGGSIIPGDKKSVKQMMAKKAGECASKIFKNEKKKINPKDDDSD